MEEKIKEIIDKEINPILARDGGSAEFVSFKDGVLKVKLNGACAGCPYSAMTISNVVESMLKDKLSEVKKIETIS